jgi:hypothetical protein
MWKEEGMKQASWKLKSKEMSMQEGAQSFIIPKSSLQDRLKIIRSASEAEQNYPAV